MQNKRPKPRRIAFCDTTCNTWFERDRAHVELSDSRGRTILEFWDESVTEAIEDGFLDSRDFHSSIFQYARHLGLVRLPYMEVSQ